MPPVFGPGDEQHARRRQQLDVHRHGRRGAALRRVVEPVDHALDEQRVPALAQFDVAGGREHRLHRVHRVGEPRPRLQQVEFFGHGQRHAEIARPRPEAIAQLEQDAEDLLRFFLFGRHDVVVDLDRRHRLEEQTGAARRRAVHDAGNRRLVFGPHHQHEAAVPAGHHLLLQVLGRVAALGELLERGAQLGPLPAQPLANRRQSWTRLVEHLAVHVDGPSHRGDLVRERRQARHQLLQDRVGTRRAVHGGLRVGNRGHEVGQDAQLQRLERPPFDRQRLERVLEARASAQREDRVLLDVAHRFGRGRERLGHDRAVDLRLLPQHARLAHGREREAGERRDDAVEFEGAEQGGVHRQGLGSRGWRGWGLGRATVTLSEDVSHRPRRRTRLLHARRRHAPAPSTQPPGSIPARPSPQPLAPSPRD